MAKKDAKHMAYDFRQQAKEIRHFIAKELPAQAAEDLQSIVDESFAKEQYQGDKKSSKWSSTSSKDASTGRKKRNALLVDSGDLIKSVVTEANKGIVSASSDRTTSKDKWNLAKIHNEGLSPQKQRKFMPIPGEESAELTKRIEKRAKEAFDKILK